jgi:deoxycytidine triphosphate deaminase
MSLMSYEEMKATLGRELKIGPVDKEGTILPLDDEDCIQPIGFDFRIGNEIWLWSTQKVVNPDIEEVYLKPGESAVIKTYEYLQVPPDMAGMIQSKVSWVSLGISHISTTIDPTFRGHLAIAIANLGVKDLPLKYKSKFATGIFYKLNNETKMEFVRPHQDLKKIIQVFANERGIDYLAEKRKEPKDATLPVLLEEIQWRGKPFDTIYFLLTKCDERLVTLENTVRGESNLRDRVKELEVWKEQKREKSTLWWIAIVTLIASVVAAIISLMLGKLWGVI